MRTEATRLAVADEFLERGVNIDFSGGEQKRAETLQLALLKPKFAILDELDSGLDVDALRDVSRRIEAMTEEDGLGVLAITHYARLLTELRPDVVHVFMAGRIITSGGPELADELEQTGYDGLAERLGIEVPDRRRPPRRPRRPLRRTRLLSPPPPTSVLGTLEPHPGGSSVPRIAVRWWAWWPAAATVVGVVGGTVAGGAVGGGATGGATGGRNAWSVVGAIGVLEKTCAGVPPNT